MSMNRSKTIQVVALSPVPFLPLIHGLLRGSVEQDARLAKSFRFLPPVFVSEPFEKIVENIEMPDILALSCYPWNFMRNMKIARWFKKRRPDGIVVAGGGMLGEWGGDKVHYSRDVDIFVNGEGEITFKNVLRQICLPNPKWSSISGISYWDQNRLIENPMDDDLPELDLFPSPYLNGYLDSAIAECYSRGLWFIALWETNRGCPHKCAFCEWGANSRNRIRLVSEELVLSEIEYFSKNKIESIMICDANFGILPRDINIINQLVMAKKNSGYPKSIRINFSKNLNERVFKISQCLHINNLHLGTTFSAQSMNQNTLNAISRKKINLENVRKTLSAYVKENIPTYTELILGLPLETKKSFIEGIGELLNVGVYDIRCYELVLFPNLPISSSEKLDEYGIECQDKELYLLPSETPDDEREKVKMVISTNTMSRDDWLECRIFVEIIQALHTGIYTRYLSEYLNREHNFSYQKFYQSLIAWGNRFSETVFGMLIRDMRDLFRRYCDNSSIPQMQLVASQPSLSVELSVYGHRGGWRPDQWIWLRLMSSHDQFFQEIRRFLGFLGIPSGTEIEDLINFQSDIILRPDYNPLRGKIVSYKYDWHRWFQMGGEIKRRPTTIHYKDTHMGANKQFPIKPNNLRAFALSAVGPSYPFLRVRHFQHQFCEAEIFYD